MDSLVDHFSFSQLSLVLQRKVIEKMEYIGFIRLHSCSSSTNYLCDMDRSLHNVNVNMAATEEKMFVSVPPGLTLDHEQVKKDKIGFTVGTLSMVPSSRLIADFLNTWKSGIFSYGLLRISSNGIFCTPTEFNEFIVQTGIRNVVSVRFPREFVTEAVMNLDSLSCMSSDFTNQELLKLKCKELSVDHRCEITADGVIELIREWQQDKRPIGYLKIVLFDITLTELFEEKMKPLNPREWVRNSSEFQCEVNREGSSSEFLFVEARVYNDIIRLRCSSKLKKHVTNS